MNLSCCYSTRKDDRDFGTLAVDRMYRDLATVGFDQALHDRCSQARTSSSRCVKRLEKPSHLLRCQSGPIVAQRHTQCHTSCKWLFVPSYLDFDRILARCQRILHDISEDLLEGKCIHVTTQTAFRLDVTKCGNSSFSTQHQVLPYLIRKLTQVAMLMLQSNRC